MVGDNQNLKFPVDMDHPRLSFKTTTTELFNHPFIYLLSQLQGQCQAGIYIHIITENIHAKLSMPKSKSLNAYMYCKG